MCRLIVGVDEAVVHHLLELRQLGVHVVGATIGRHDAGAVELRLVVGDLKAPHAMHA